MIYTKSMLRDGTSERNTDFDGVEAGEGIKKKKQCEHKFTLLFIL